MKTQQLHFVNKQWTDVSSSDKFNAQKAQLVLAFGSGELITNKDILAHLKKTYPTANIIGASTSGEIMNDGVFDNSVAVTAIEFEKTKVKCAETNVSKHANSFDTGKELMLQLYAPDLISVFVISDGTKINGSELVSGFNENNSKQVPVTGGLAGDAANFTQTFVGLNVQPDQGNVIAVGFYGSNLKIGHGSFGGWDEFGRERTISKSDKNVLYEIDDRSALDLYKEYLGPYADELPGSALLFPISIKIEGSDKNLVRTILSINENDKSMTFAGNLPVGSKVRLMKANFKKLIDGSSIAAKYSLSYHEEQAPQLALLISCVGRKLILQERSYEEVQAAKNIMGNNTSITGFYSYGEISPFNPSPTCELHNQTMTITTFTEIL
jgi:hypothetical protein